MFCIYLNQPCLGLGLVSLLLNFYCILLRREDKRKLRQDLSLIVSDEIEMERVNIVVQSAFSCVVSGHDDQRLVVLTFLLCCPTRLQQ